MLISLCGRAFCAKDPTGPQSIPSNTATGTGATSTPTPALVFDLIPSLNTCFEERITWDYFGASQQLQVTVTNVGVNQSPDSSSVIGGVGKRDAVTEVLFSQPANFQNFTWAVNVPQGFYVLNGLLMTGQTPQSGTFFVANSTNTSCIGQSSSTTAAGSSSTATGHSSSLTSSPPASKTSSSTTSSQTGVLSAAGGSSKSSKTGAIAGGVVAAVVVIGAVLGAIYYLCRVAPSRRRSQLAGGEKRQWGGLSDRKSARGFVRSAPVAGAARAAAAGAAPTPGSSNEDFDKEYVGAVRSAPGGLGSSVMPLGYDDSHSTFAPSVIAPSPLRTKMSSRAPSSRTSIDTANTQPSSPHRASRTRSGAYGSSGAVGVQSMPERAAPRSSLDLGRNGGTESIPMARTGSQHRPARKPVPQYNAAEMATAASTSSSTRNLASTSSSPVNEFGVGVGVGAAKNPFDTQPSSPTTTSNSHGQSSPIAAASYQSGNELLSRASAQEREGSRQVHYLIPDMPQPQSP